MIKKKTGKYYQKGQVVIISLLVMAVVLAIGLTIVGRSMTEISTSTKTENSSRAFSAAEAGIEQALNSGASTGSLSLDNQSTYKFDAVPDLPKNDNALEYPPFGKDSFAQFWLANPSTLAPAYTQTAFNLYFGNVKDYSEDHENEPAVEVRVVKGSLINGFTSQKYLYDSYNGNDNTRLNNGFSDCVVKNPVAIKTNDSTAANSSFYCQVSVPSSNDAILVRVRLLYTNLAHPVALQPNSGYSLPPQAKKYSSIGTSGESQRQLQVFQMTNVLPYIFDYAVFSAGALSK